MRGFARSPTPFSNTPTRRSRTRVPTPHTRDPPTQLRDNWTGIGKYLKEKSGGKTQIWLADPPGSVLYSYVTSGGKLNERSGSSITEGIGQGRITKNLGTFVNDLSGALHIPDEESIAMVYEMLDTEGLYIGASSALNVVAAVKLAQKLGPGKTVATLICDGAYRYQTRLFSKKWLQAKGLDSAIPAHLKKYANYVSFGMANSMGEPWIGAYFIDVGERFEGSLTNEPYREKKKIVQLIEFLTVPLSDTDQCSIWAVVSDKLHKIPVNAVPTAIGALKYICRKNAGNPLTSRTNTIVTINKFRPVFTRVVLGNNIRKLSSESYLALEVGSIVVLGSEGENVFGSPRSVEENDKVKLWVTDMRKPGGNG
ncbi:hypothetical protein HWV62_16648 [Athelia sp. TMB]|nr:hypothetical protein HWV62_16648 [Athelia sp. TMB]